MRSFIFGACCGAAAVAAAMLVFDPGAPGPETLGVVSSTVTPSPPPALSAEHAKILLSEEPPAPSLPELHARLLAEPKQEAWSASTEGLIRQGLSELGSNVELHTVECRVTLCEVLAFGNDANALREWQQTIARHHPSWRAAGLVDNAQSISGQNGRYVIVSILQRRRP